MSLDNDLWLQRRLMEENFGQSEAQLIEDFIRSVIADVEREGEDHRVAEGDDQREIKGY